VAATTKKCHCRRRRPAPNEAEQTSGALRLILLSSAQERDNVRVETGIRDSIVREQVSFVFDSLVFEERIEK